MLPFEERLRTHVEAVKKNIESPVRIVHHTDGDGLTFAAITWEALGHPPLHPTWFRPGDVGRVEARTLIVGDVPHDFFRQIGEFMGKVVVVDHHRDWPPTYVQLNPHRVYDEYTASHVPTGALAYMLFQPGEHALWKVAISLVTDLAIRLEPWRKFVERYTSDEHFLSVLHFFKHHMPEDADEARRIVELYATSHDPQELERKLKERMPDTFFDAQKAEEKLQRVLERWEDLIVKQEGKLVILRGEDAFGGRIATELSLRYPELFFAHIVKDHRTRVYLRWSKPGFDVGKYAKAVGESVGGKGGGHSMAGGIQGGSVEKLLDALVEKYLEFSGKRRQTTLFDF